MRYGILLLIVFIFSSFTGEESASVIQSKLLGIQKEVTLTYNPKVHNYIEVYGEKKRNLTESMLAKGEFYFPIFERVLEEYNLPTELKYMAVIESALNPRAISPMGAKGLWQFMHGTAKGYKLTINSNIDERCDVELSTIAAAKYLKNMYAKFGDWQLAIAAYNCGAGNVSKAIKRSGGKTSFWEIYNYLPKETRSYVPAFIGAVYVFEYAQDFGLQPNYDATEYLTFKPVELEKYVWASDLIKLLELDEKSFKNANASLVGNYIPGNYKLKIPTGKHEQFYTVADSLYALALAKPKQRNITKTAKSKEPIQIVIPDETKFESISYKVKQGDNLGFIALWFDIALNKLQAWNQIARSFLRVDQELIVYVPKEKASFYAHFDKLSKRQKNLLTTDRSKRMMYAKRMDNKYIYHEVKKGETISTILQQYPNTSIDTIKRLNPISSNEIKPGMYLKILPLDV